MTRLRQGALWITVALLLTMAQGCLVLRKQYYVDGVQGRIVDENKKPVARAKVKTTWWYETSKGGGERRKIEQNAVTDLDGRFQTEPFWKYKWESMIPQIIGYRSPYTKQEWTGMYVKAREVPEQNPKVNPAVAGASTHAGRYYILREDIVVSRKPIKKPVLIERNNKQ